MARRHRSTTGTRRRPHGWRSLNNTLNRHIDLSSLAPVPYHRWCRDRWPRAHSGFDVPLWGAYHRTRNRGSRFTGQIDSAHRGLPFGSQPSRTIHGSRRDAELALAELRVEHSHCLTPLSHTTLDVLIDQFLSAPTRSGSPRGPGNGESAGLVLWRYRNTACIFML